MLKKNEDIIKKLGDHFTLLGSKKRLVILKFLYNREYITDYSEIQNALKFAFKKEKINISYHLSNLVEKDYIYGDETGYQLTQFGRKIFEKIKDIEELLSDNSPILIRTSKYSLEPFDEEIIEQNLIKEANIPKKIAKKIAIEAKQRLKKAKVTYLTAPLIREYINAILIENQYEDYRHKLTRLGLPPFDIKEKIKSNKVKNPVELRSILGHSTLEQYILLNQMQQNYADSVLSGAFVLSNLEHYGITPIELVMSGKNLIKSLDFFFTQNKNNLKSLKNKSNGTNNIFRLSILDLILVIRKFFRLLIPFFPSGLSIVRFDEFIEKFLEKYTELELKELMFGCFTDLDGENEGWAISLEISLIANPVDINPLLSIYVKSLQLPIYIWSKLPLLEIFHQKSNIRDFLGCSTANKLKKQQKMILKLLFHHQVNLNKFSKWGNPDVVHIFSNLQIPICFKSTNSIKPTIILEKISINLLNIFNASRHEKENGEKSFFRLLEMKIHTVFNYFEKKTNLLSRNLVFFKDWKKIFNILFRNKQSIFPFPSICGISIHGLDEFIFAKTEFFMKDQKKNREFGVEIIDFVYKLLEKQNKLNKNQIKYVFSEPNHQKELLYPTNNILETLSDLNKKHQIKSKNNGYRFGYHTSSKKLSLDHLKKIYLDITKSKFEAISLNYKYKEWEFYDLNSTINDISSCSYDIFLNLLKNLLSTDVCRISISNDFKFYNNSTSSKILLKQYSRFYHKYK